MTTKFILHGGFHPGEVHENDDFFGEMLKGTSQKATILIVYFAKEPDRIAKNYEEDVEQFNKNKGDKILSFEIANENKFVEQVKNADVIYLHGGKTGRLLDTLNRLPDLNLKKLFEGKIVGGDSAGANVLSTACYSLSLGVLEGFGVIPIKIICHYLEENRHKLDHIYPDLETVYLAEKQFKVFNLS